MDITVSGLQTTVGIAFIVALLMRLLVKPGLTNLIGENNKWYSFSLNGFAVILGVTFAILGGAVTGIQYSDGLQAVLNGVTGAGLATLGYEGYNNFRAEVIGK